MYSSFGFAFSRGGSNRRNARPAAWLHLQRQGAVVRNCTQQAAAFLGGNLFTPATLNLNIYYVLTLNQDATISVVDPLFGFGGTNGTLIFKRI